MTIEHNLKKYLEGKSAKDILSILQSFNTATKQGASLEPLVPKSGVAYDVGVIGSTIDKLSDLKGSDDDKQKTRELLKALLPDTTDAEWLTPKVFTTHPVMTMMVKAFQERSEKELKHAEHILTKEYATNDPILYEDSYPQTTKVFEGMMKLNRFVTVSFNPKDNTSSVTIRYGQYGRLGNHWTGDFSALQAKTAHEVNRHNELVDINELKKDVTETLHRNIRRLESIRENSALKPTNGFLKDGQVLTEVDTVTEKLKGFVNELEESEITEMEDLDDMLDVQDKYIDEFAKPLVNSHLLDEQDKTQAFRENFNLQLIKVCDRLRSSGQSEFDRDDVEKSIKSIVPGDSGLRSLAQDVLCGDTSEKMTLSAIEKHAQENGYNLVKAEPVWSVVRKSAQGYYDRYIAKQPLVGDALNAAYDDMALISEKDKDEALKNLATFQEAFRNYTIRLNAIPYAGTSETIDQPARLQLDDIFMDINSINPGDLQTRLEADDRNINLSSVQQYFLQLPKILQERLRSTCEGRGAAEIDKSITQISSALKNQKAYLDENYADQPSKLCDLAMSALEKPLTTEDIEALKTRLTDMRNKLAKFDDKSVQSSLIEHKGNLSGKMVGPEIFTAPLFDDMVNYGVSRYDSDDVKNYLAKHKTTLDGLIALFDKKSTLTAQEVQKNIHRGIQSRISEDRPTEASAKTKDLFSGTSSQTSQASKPIIDATSDVLEVSLSEVKTKLEKDKGALRDRIDTLTSLFDKMRGQTTLEVDGVRQPHKPLRPTSISNANKETLTRYRDQLVSKTAGGSPAPTQLPNIFDVTTGMISQQDADAYMLKYIDAHLVLLQNKERLAAVERFSKKDSFDLSSYLPPMPAIFKQSSTTKEEGTTFKIAPLRDALLTTSCGDSDKLRDIQTGLKVIAELTAFQQEGLLDNDSGLDYIEPLSYVASGEDSSVATKLREKIDRITTVLADENLSETCKRSLESQKTLLTDIQADLGTVKETYNTYVEAAEAFGTQLNEVMGQKLSTLTEDEKNAYAEATFWLKASVFADKAESDGYLQTAKDKLTPLPKNTRDLLSSLYEKANGLSASGAALRQAYDDNIEKQGNKFEDKDHISIKNYRDFVMQERLRKYVDTTATFNDGTAKNKNNALTQTNPDIFAIKDNSGAILDVIQALRDNKQRSETALINGKDQLNLYIQKVANEVRLDALRPYSSNVSQDVAKENADVSLNALSKIVEEYQTTLAQSDDQLNSLAQFFGDTADPTADATVTADATATAGATAKDSDKSKFPSLTSEDVKKSRRAIEGAVNDLSETQRLALYQGYSCNKESMQAALFDRSDIGAKTYLNKNGAQNALKNLDNQLRKDLAHQEPKIEVQSAKTDAAALTTDKVGKRLEKVQNSLKTFQGLDASSKATAELLKELAGEELVDAVEEDGTIKDVVKKKLDDAGVTDPFAQLLRVYAAQELQSLNKAHPNTSSQIKQAIIARDADKQYGYLRELMGIPRAQTSRFYSPSVIESSDLRTIQYDDLQRELKTLTTLKDDLVKNAYAQETITRVNKTIDAIKELQAPQSISAQVLGEFSKTTLADYQNVKTADENKIKLSEDINKELVTFDERLQALWNIEGTQAGRPRSNPDDKKLTLQDIAFTGAYLPAVKSLDDRMKQIGYKQLIKKPEGSLIDLYVIAQAAVTKQIKEGGVDASALSDVILRLEDVEKQVPDESNSDVTKLQAFNKEDKYPIIDLSGHTDAKEATWYKAVKAYNQSATKYNTQLKQVNETYGKLNTYREQIDNIQAQADTKSTLSDKLDAQTEKDIDALLTDQIDIFMKHGGGKGLQRYDLFSRSGYKALKTWKSLKSVSPIAKALAEETGQYGYLQSAYAGATGEVDRGQMMRDATTRLFNRRDDLRIKHYDELSPQLRDQLEKLPELRNYFKDFVKDFVKPVEVEDPADFKALEVEAAQLNQILSLLKDPLGYTVSDLSDDLLEAHLERSLGAEPDVTDVNLLTTVLQQIDKVGQAEEEDKAEKQKAAKAAIETKLQAAVTKAARNGKLTQASVNEALRLADYHDTEVRVTHALKADNGEYGKISRCLDAIEALKKGTLTEDESKLWLDLEKLKKGTLTEDESNLRQALEKKLKEGNLTDDENKLRQDLKNHFCYFYEIVRDSGKTTYTMTEKTDGTKSSDLKESKKHFQSALEGLESNREAKVNFDQFCTILKTIDPKMDDQRLVEAFQACEHDKYDNTQLYIAELKDIPSLNSFDVSNLLKNKETPQAAIKRYFDDLSKLKIAEPALGGDIAVANTKKIILLRELAMTKSKSPGLIDTTDLTQALRTLRDDLNKANKPIPYETLVSKINNSNSKGKSVILKLQSAIIDAKHEALKKPSATPTPEEELKQRLDRLLDDLEVHIKGRKKSSTLGPKDSQYLDRYRKIKDEVNKKDKVNKSDAYTDEEKKDFCDLLEKELETFEVKKNYGLQRESRDTILKKLEEELDIRSPGSTPSAS